jgi:hypothetical protein
MHSDSSGTARELRYVPEDVDRMKSRIALAGVLAVAAILAVGAGGDKPTSAKSKKTLVAGVAWETSFEAAKEQAKREGKPILLMQLFGKLDDEFC